MTITGNAFWSDLQHQKEKVKAPKYKPGRKLIGSDQKYYGHNPGDIWSRGAIDYDVCDTLDCGCAPKDDDDDLPCVVNDTCKVTPILLFIYSLALALVVCRSKLPQDTQAATCKEEAELLLSRQSNN